MSLSAAPSAWPVRFRQAIGVVLILVSCMAGYRVWRLEHQRRSVKSDMKELSHVTYGLFNVDEWMAIVSGIIERKVDQLEVTEENRPELKAQLVVMMGALLDEAYGSMERANDKAGLKGDVRKAALGLLVDLDAVKADLPRYADRLLDEVNKPASRDRIRSLLHKEFTKLADSTTSLADYAARDRILLREGHCDTHSCIVDLDARAEELSDASRNMMLMLVACMLALVLLVVLSRSKSVFDQYLLTVGACLLLALGVQLPMIDIEASVSRFQIQLIGEGIAFQDQVLYYQSKSILEVVWLMLSENDAGLVLIGCLVLLFSIILPAAKLSATLRVLLMGRAPITRIGQFLVFRSGKWSMADVLVVAMFMTYLGFSGIVNGQLAQLEMHDPRTELLTTNGSELQTGFYLFLAYCVMGLVISTLVQRKYAAH